MSGQIFQAVKNSFVACEQALLFGRASGEAARGLGKQNLQRPLIKFHLYFVLTKGNTISWKLRSGNQSRLITGLADLPKIFSFLSPLPPPPGVSSSLACLSRVDFSRYPPNEELARRLIRPVPCLSDLRKTVIILVILLPGAFEFPIPNLRNLCRFPLP